MARRRLRGDRSFKKLIRKMPAAIRDEMVTMMEEAGREILAMQQADAVVSTRVRKALAMRVLRGQMQLKVGLLGRPINKRLWWARIIEKGRKAQTVIAVRGAAHLKAGGRRVGRRQRALDQGIAGVYRMRVSALPPRPAIYSQRVLAARETLGGRTVTFWEKVLARASEGANDA